MPAPLQVAGSAFAPARIDIEIDMSRQIADHDLDQALLRTIYHEFHHVLRWDGPGYGTTLGEALVSEGLAQVFVHEMMECPPEPWERAITGAPLNRLSRFAYQMFENTDYTHSAWFFGTGDMPAWAGYSIGRRMAGRYLAHHKGETALSCATRSAMLFKPFLV